MVTIKDIAKAVGVSYSTVSRALNNQPGTNAETRAQILKVAKEMGYEPNAIARSLVTSKSMTLAFVLPDLSNPFFTAILQAAEHEADERGYQLLICETRWDSEKEKKEIRMLSEKRVDGILLYPSQTMVDEQMLRSHTPVVVFGHSKSGGTESCRFVEVDNATGSRLAVDHLLACGYRRLAYVGGPEYSGSNFMRQAMFRETLRQRDLPLLEALVTAGDYTVDSGWEATKSLMKLPADKRPDSLVCANDLIALGALQALSELGIDVPGEVGVIGFDDVKYASLPQIRLSTIRIPCEEMGRMGTRLLLGQLENHAEWSSLTAGCRIVLEPRLIHRQTTAPRPGFSLSGQENLEA